MNTEDHSPQHENGAAESLTSAYSAEEIKELEMSLAELRAQGILIGGDGPREALRPVARVLGGLERFLAERE